MEIISLSQNKEDQDIAVKLAEELGLTLCYEEQDIKQEKLMLRMDEEGLALVGYGLELRGDLTKMLPRIKAGNFRSEMIIKAAKIKDAEDMPVVVDATAGLGEDSILLAAAGFRVYLYEYNPIIAALLQDAMRRAMEIPELKDIVGRMQLFAQDSLKALPALTFTPDVVVLDPMFPARQKSALVKKKFQLLQHLEQPCTAEEDLMHAAMEAHPRKIVVKRPSKGPNLAGIKPSYSIEGKGIRYDCIMLL